MSKTIREYLEELPEPYRTQAINNCIEDSSMLIIDDVCTEQNSVDALAAAFSWNKSKEGHNYWANVYYYLLDSDKLIKEANQILNK